MRTNYSGELKEIVVEIIKTTIEKCLKPVEIRVTGVVDGKEKGGDIITIKTEQGDIIKVDINDGVTDSKVFEIGDSITGLLLSGAYFEANKNEIVFIFSTPQAE